MIRFTNDYSQGAHPDILQAITEVSMEGNFGYGCDPHTQRAARLIGELCQCEGAAVHFLMGGTQTNMTAISAFLKPYQAAIAADSGHICTHETGAVEGTGHKCIAVPTEDGKLTPDHIRQVMEAHPDEHMVQPKLVYISNTTEWGGFYTTGELEALRQVCEDYHLWLYLDGARLGSALAAGVTTLPDLARVCHAFYIGGTKNGALFGEALVIVEPALQADFRYHMKHRGGMLAKGFLLGVQFEKLMEHQMGRYLAMADHANQMAGRLRQGLEERGYPFYVDSLSNQIFPILPNALLQTLEGDFHWEVTRKMGDGNTVIRLVTSWATTPQEVEAFLAKIPHKTVELHEVI